MTYWENPTMSESKTPPISALALAKRSNAISIVICAEDVRRFAPSWSEPEAARFLRQHQNQIAHVMIAAGLTVVAAIIEQQGTRYES